MSATEPRFAFPFDQDEWDELRARLHLSGRESEILHGILADRKDAEIARDLGISIHTLRTHVERLHAKLGVEDRVQLVCAVFRGLLEMMEDPGCDSARRRRICGRHG